MNQKFQGLRKDSYSSLEGRDRQTRRLRQALSTHGNSIPKLNAPPERLWWQKQRKPVCGKGAGKPYFRLLPRRNGRKPENKANLFHIREPASLTGVLGLSGVVISRSFDEPNCATGNRKRSFIFPSDNQARHVCETLSFWNEYLRITQITYKSVQTCVRLTRQLFNWYTHHIEGNPTSS